MGPCTRVAGEKKGDLPRNQKKRQKKIVYGRGDARGDLLTVQSKKKPYKKTEGEDIRKKVGGKECLQHKVGNHEKKSDLKKNQ